MPKYDYGCACGNSFEEYGSRDSDSVECPVCHKPARRRPFSGVPHIKGETVARSIPDPAYRMEAEKRDLNRTWGDASRSVELLRKNIHEDANGMKQVDLKGMTA